MSSLISTIILTLGLLLWGWMLTTGRVQAWLATPGRMPAWRASGTDFMLFALSVAMVVAIAPAVVVSVMGLFLDLAESEPEVNLANAIGTQGGALLVCLAFWINPSTRPDRETAPRRLAWLAAVVGFLLVLPVLAGLQLAWEQLMQSLGIEAPPQDILDYIRSARSPLQVVLWAIVAVGLAPLTEELALRAGLFRFLAMRMPPVAAAGLSAAIFGLLHANLYAFLPLTALGFVLALVYHRSGRISSAILLHALFNATSLLFVFLGAAE